MDTKKRGNDAQDHAPQPKQDKRETPGDKQDATNHEGREDDDNAIEVENMSSANDEGAN